MLLDIGATHYLFPNTLSRLRELGALDRIEARHRLNPLHYAVRVLGEEVAGPFTPVDGFDRMCGVTRPVLDQALLDVAVAAGAETRFGEKVTGLVGAGSAADPIRGVEMEGGEEIEARWVLGADGRASTVASLLGLEKQRQVAGEIGIMLAYWRGLPVSDSFRVAVLFAGLASDPEAGQAFRDTFTRHARPRSDVLTRERLEHWFAKEPAGAV